MPSLKTIRKRITSVKATQKITRAMKMVAGARLNRAQSRITALRPYALKTQEVLQGLANAMIAKQQDIEYTTTGQGPTLHPLLQRRQERTILLLVLSGDRGLCGAFNANVSKAAERTWRDKKSSDVEVLFGTVGKKGRDYLARRRATITRDFPKLYDGLDLAKSAVVSDWVIKKFEKAEIDAVYIVYNEFKSAITQKTVVEQLLPLPEPQGDEEDLLTPTEYGFEPNEQVVLERLMPMYVQVSIFRALLESQASEHGARMTAMDAATRNAKDMIGRLTLQYNRARQAAITKELMEIIGGAEALKE
ncbi:ATP synthase gamma chain [Labilithrix luteola]|uniref:ATP synthase gamma chain n=1 Tax=Labilithrix luteola TaxID=1391654 RepID=A0A0K1PKY1_9BACT|nr:ATP synthase F1 subunit gamma [Labilithrix luteola]AKU94061.1 ATP synthase gamma chain [Labilithrix luteola]